MCQSKSQGGRRCSGASRSMSPTASSSSQASTAVLDQPGAPTRSQTDELAAALPSDRKGWDGQPLNDADRRLYALRDSGYKGPIDQDGYPDTTSRGAEILADMARRAEAARS